MRLSKFLIGVWLAALAIVEPAYAQPQELVPGPQVERYEELATWLKEYYAWEEWFERWGNRVARNFADQHIWERKQRPEPPVWLQQECQGDLGVDGLLASACTILRNWDDQPLRILQRRRKAALVTSRGNVDDKVEKTSFYQRLHLTGLWTRAQYPNAPVYGIIGMQMAVFEVGRFTMPAIGVMAVMMPDGEGGHNWRPATTLAFGYRLSDFVVPFLRRPASLHINIARTSIHGVHDERFAPGMLNSNFFGLSVSGKKRR